MKGECMEQYASFIRKALIVYLFICLLGVVVFYGAGYSQYIFGWLWGNMINFLYLVLLKSQYKKLGNTPTFQVVGQVRWQMTQRMLLVLASVIIGTQIHEINTYVVVSTVCFMQVLLYIVYWYTSR